MKADVWEVSSVISRIKISEFSYSSLDCSAWQTFYGFWMCQRRNQIQFQYSRPMTKKTIELYNKTNVGRGLIYRYGKIISDSWRHRKITTLIMFTRMRNLFQVTEIPLEPSPHQLRVSRSLARLFILLIAIVIIFSVMSLAKLLIITIINLILLINVTLLCSTSPSPGLSTS